MFKHEIVVSMHIPKTGGVTLKNILSDVYGEGFLWFTETNSARYTFERLRGYFKEEPSRDIKCIHGHIGYGIHKYLETIGIGCKYILFTRPIGDRLLSYYNYIMTEAVKSHYNWEDRFGWEDGISFMDWLSSCKMADQDNSLTRFLSGCENLNTDPTKYRMCREDYILATENSKNLSFVGSISNFDTEIERLANTLSWEHIPKYGRDNAYPDHRYSKDLTNEELDLINETQRFDIALYNNKLKKVTQ